MLFRDAAWPQPPYEAAHSLLYEGDCKHILPLLPAESVDAIIADPLYPEVNRKYGRMTSGEWLYLMKVVVAESRRILKPTGSAVFILQPNSVSPGTMRTWLWDFQAWVSHEWNVVQDLYWWNTAAVPTVHSRREFGLLRPSVKTCVWLGPPDCYRNQDEVLWEESQRNIAERASQRLRPEGPRPHLFGHTCNQTRHTAVAEERGGVTPFNLLPIPNTNSKSSGGADGHPAATPLALCSWLVRYLTPPGGLVLDPFAGSGTVGQAAIQHGCQFVGIEKEPAFVKTAAERLNLKLAATAA